MRSRRRRRWRMAGRWRMCIKRTKGGKEGGRDGGRREEL